MENPVVAFRRSKGWTRREFLRRSGMSYQTLRNIEIGETKRMTDQTKECLSFTGIDANIQDRLDEWHQYRLENRRNGIFDGIEG
jgi:transcriptional regulator with XRE-family HTH domain